LAKAAAVFTPTNQQPRDFAPQWCGFSYATSFSLCSATYSDASFRNNVIMSCNDGRKGSSRRQSGNGSNASVRSSPNTFMAVNNNAE
jgi:hypothetical protein